MRDGLKLGKSYSFLGAREHMTRKQKLQKRCCEKAVSSLREIS